ncbi:MAG: HlyD family type I secretion periplasmic adaptor subunit [Gammaproteobacteria bacterium]
MFLRKKQIEEVDVQYMSDASGATLMGAPIVLHSILWISALFILVAIVWADFAVLDVVTVGQGKVIPSSNMQVVQNLEGGIIKDIRVKEGDVVERDQVLMVIDDTRFSSSFKENEVQLYALQAKMERLEAEAEGRDLTWSKDLEKLYPGYVKQEYDLYTSRQKGLEVKLNILNDQKEEKEQELVELKGKKDQIEKSLELVKKELVLTRPLVKDGAVSEVELLRLERTVNDLTGDLNGTTLAIPRLESAIGGAKRKIEELIITSKTEAMSDLNATRAEYSKMTETIKAAKDRVNRTVVRSPVRGTVNQVKVSTIGAVIQPGAELIDIVPLDDTLLVEANVRPSDIGFLRPGLPATVKITAYDFSIYGGLKAVVEHISPDTITNEKGESFYQIRVRTEENSFLMKKGEQLPIIPGMGATVDILTGQKTVLDYLLKPILKAKQNAMREP